MTDSRPRLLILGSHIFAEEVADLVHDAGTHQLAGFVENRDRRRCAAGLLGLPVHWAEDIDALAVDHQIVCAIGSNARRAYVADMVSRGFRMATIVHPSATLAPSCQVAPGTICGAGVIVGARASIGQDTILNRGVLIGHHTTVGDHVTVSPGANVAGKVEVGDGAYIGMGAIILDRRRVGAGSVVAAGSIVTHDVAANTQVMGAPARVVGEAVDGR